MLARIGVLSYATLALAVSVLALAFAMPFVRSFFGFELEGSATIPAAVAFDALLVALFGLQHSVMARRSYREAYGRLFPASTERVTYTLASCLALALVAALWRPLSGVAWHVTSPFVAWPVAFFGGAGWLFLAWSFVAMNAGDLLGTRQIAEFLRNGQSAPVCFRMPGPYRYVRHPLMLGMLVGLWVTPTMSWSRLLFAAATSLYVVIGIRLEERDLLQDFGTDYRDYRERVPMLVPRLSPRRRPWTI